MTFLEIYNASFVSWDPALRVIYLTNSTDQKQYMTELKLIWLVMCPETLRKLFRALSQKKQSEYFQQ